MQIRLTKARLALAGLALVLAAASVASVASPVVGTALATAGQIVNISDPSAAYTARVDSTGALKTAGTVTGSVSPSVPRLPFNTSTSTTQAVGYKTLLGPTNATIALTDLKISNDFANGARKLLFSQFSAPAPNTSCTGTSSRALGVYGVRAAETIHANFQTPLLLRPLASGHEWCLLVIAYAASGTEPKNAIDISVGGYVPSGTFFAPGAEG